VTWKFLCHHFDKYGLAVLIQMSITFVTSQRSLAAHLPRQMRGTEMSRERALIFNQWLYQEAGVTTTVLGPRGDRNMVRVMQPFSTLTRYVEKKLITTAAGWAFVHVT